MIKTIDVPGGRLVAEAEGDGPAIVLVHSALVNRRAWDDFTPLLVDAGYRVIRYDMRGWGESTTDPVAYRPGDDLAAVLEAFGAERAAVIGNSMGAGFMLDAALERPDRFAAFVWLGGGISGYDKGTTEAEEALFEAEAQAEDDERWDDAAELDTQIWVDGVGQPASRVSPKVRADVLRMDRENLEPGREFGSPQRAQPQAVDRLADLQVPTLVVIGALDTSGTRASADKLSSEAPYARLVTYPDVAHMIAMEVPERLAADVLDFLAPLRPWK